MPRTITSLLWNNIYSVKFITLNIFTRISLYMIPQNNLNLLAKQKYFKTDLDADDFDKWNS